MGLDEAVVKCAARRGRLDPGAETKEVGNVVPIFLVNRSRAFGQPCRKGLDDGLLEEPEQLVHLSNDRPYERYWGGWITSRSQRCGKNCDTQIPQLPWQKYIPQAKPKILTSHSRPTGLLPPSPESTGSR